MCVEYPQHVLWLRNKKNIYFQLRTLIWGPVIHVDSNQPTSVAPWRGATREMVALRLERLCSVLFTPIHLQIRIENIFEIAQVRYLYRVNTENQSRSNYEPNSTVEKYVVIIFSIEKIQKVKVNSEDAIFVDIKVIF